jgi:hypothetical protein
MSEIWNRMETCADSIRYKMLSKQGMLNIDPALEKYNWENHVYISKFYRRGHVEIVDRREDVGLFILHATIFPHVDSSAPIWGFDAVCGKNKITGAFHDFSLPGTADHPMSQWWENKSSGYIWNKPRELPSWAQAIFSKNMVAAGNVQELNEVDQFINLGLESLDYYLANAVNYRQENTDFSELQNKYCHYQKQNPHVVRSMVAMGYEQPIIEQFVEEVLFPEIA